MKKTKRNIKEKISLIKNFIERVKVAVKTVCTRIGNWRKKHPRLFWGTVGGMAMLLILAMLFSGKTERIGLDFTAPNPMILSDHGHLTTTQEDTSSKVRIPEPAKNRKLGEASVFRLYFKGTKKQSSNVAAPEFIGKNISNHVKINPLIPGEWRFEKANEITFKPQYDWPADTKFDVSFDKKLFERNIGGISLSFNTAPFQTKLESFSMYPNPLKQKTLVAVARLDFTHEVDITDLEKRVSFQLDGKKVEFSIRSDNLGRQAFIYSKPIDITEKSQTLKFSGTGIKTTQGGAVSKDVTASLSVAAADDFFKISDVDTRIVRNTQDVQEQIIMLEFTDAPVNPEKHISVYQLPKDKSSSKPISPEMAESMIKEKSATKLKLKPLPMESSGGIHGYGLAFAADPESGNKLYFKMDAGIKSENGFEIKTRYDTFLTMPRPTKTVKIVGNGSILPLGGSQELSFVAEGGVKTIKVELARINTNDINHLVTQTSDTIPKANFRNYNFDESNISTIFKKDVRLSGADSFAVKYASINLGNYVNSSTKGIFIIDAYDDDSYRGANSGDRRLVVLTDIGIVHKMANDGTSSVFAVSVSTGRPVSGAVVSVLGRNGTSIYKTETNSSGRAELPHFRGQEYAREKYPVAITVSDSGDLSFIQYGYYNNLADYSKYDIEGVYQDENQTLDAYLFSDRGIYRPGEDAVITGMIKEREYKSVSGMPFLLRISDSKEDTISEKRFSAGRDAMFDHKFQVPSAAPIGSYNVRLYQLSDSGDTRRTIGNANFMVEEFVPDNLRIKINLVGAKTDGWTTLDELSAKVSLQNLFGTPAQGRRISARLSLSPVRFSFEKFKDYVFQDNFIDGTEMAKGAGPKDIVETLKDSETDKKGEATLPLSTETPISGTFAMSLEVQGFEGGGKSVSAITTARISNAKYLVGYKPSASLSYANRNAVRTINFVAVAPDLSKAEVNDLGFRLVQKKTLTSLVKNYDGQYKYQSVTQNRVLSNTDFSIPKNGHTVKLDTTTPGDFYIEVVDAAGKILAHIPYFVAGGANTTVQTDTNAELKIKLDKKTYTSGDTIDISIVAPYAGTGLITIENDKVHAHSWFKTTSTASTESIRIPNDFEGSGYINISFVRDINSPDVFSKPHVFAVTPFHVENPARRIKINLDAPRNLKGRTLNIGYSLSRPASFAVFAVNEGVLQVAKYKTPAPFEYFFKKLALRVKTYQILGYLLPDYRVLRYVAGIGGGDDFSDEALARAKSMVNPFARKTDKTVAFHSGIIRDTQSGNVSFDIPESFNGELRIFAVASDGRAFGATEMATTVKSPVVIVPSVPLAGAPNDTFDVSAIITNASEGLAGKGDFKISIQTSGGIELSNVPDKVTVPEGEERKITFKAKALEKLGNASIKIMATADDATGTAESNVSIRPTSIFITNIKTGKDSGNFAIKNWKTEMFGELLSRKLYISDSAIVMIKPLLQYLEKYDFGCSEQRTSKALPLALFAGNEMLGVSQEDAKNKIAETLAVLKNRQMADGSFRLWDSGDSAGAWLASYVTHFLTLAKQNGFTVNSEMMSNAVSYLKRYAGNGMSKESEITDKAYAIYVLTLNETVTTNYIGMFEEFANDKAKNWEKGIAGTYIAASYKMLKQNDRADSLSSKFSSKNFLDVAKHAHLMRKHFDKNIDAAIDAVESYVNKGNYGSFASAIAALAVSPTTNDGLEDVVVMAGKTSISPNDSKSKILTFNIPNTTDRLDIKGADRNVYWSLSEQGFPKDDGGKSNGLSVYREYTDKDGNVVTSAKIGDDLTVTIYAKTTGNVETVDNVAIVDLLPTGFAAATDSIESPRANFTEAREDRVLVFTTIGKEYSKTTYRVKATTSGRLKVPAIKAQAMYNPEIRGYGDTGTFQVE